MKKIVIILLLLTSCQENRIASNALDGTWFLEKAECFCFFKPEFNFNAHSLTFNGKAEKVSISNTEETFFITKKGDYHYRISGEELIINSTIKYKYSFANNRLILTFIDDPRIADDEITLTYTR